MSMTAVRALRRVLKEKAIINCEAAMADAGFDAGEFSYGFHARAWDETVTRVTALVADRFGLTPRALDDALCAAEYHESVMLFGH